MRLLLSLFVVCLVTHFGVAQQPTRPVVVEDYFTLRTITEFATSPTSDRVAYTLAVWDKADDARKSDLWLVNTKTKSETRLTFDRANDRHLRFSADGQHIYFLGNRKRENETKPPYDGKTQVWRIHVDGTGLMAVTRIAGGVAEYDLAATANQLFLTTETEFADEDDFAKLRAKYAKNEYGHGVRKVSELHRLDLQTWVLEKLPTDKRYIRTFAVTRDGKRVAMVSAFDDTVVKSEGESRVDVWENGKTTTPPTEAYRAKAASPYAWLEGLTWSPDGTKFSFVAIHDAFPAEAIVGDLSSAEAQVYKVKREGWQVVGYGRAVGPPVQFNPSGNLIVQTEASGIVGYGVWDFATSQFAATAIKGNVTAVSPKMDVELRSTETSFADLYMGGEPLTTTNPQVKSWQLPEVKHITWKAPDGAMVGGVLELPHGYKPGTKVPLVVGIHGGPTTSSKADLAFDPHNGRLYWTMNGYAVLQPNYRGSTGYGDKFLIDLVGQENDIEVKDILAGVQHLVKEGIADPDRVGCMGWSNGGYLTNCLITLKDSPVKFKAASSGAGILDTVAEWGFNDEPAYPIVFKKGLPWEQPDLYKKTSPTYGLGNANTPTIIHVGGADDRCPPGHSRMLYRALKENRKVPTELIVYTGEPHGLSKLSNRKAKMEFDLAWFAKYMK
jgi:dipeptidyl aminopeptidase/acylaminoacyl peptidase